NVWETATTTEYGVQFITGRASRPGRDDRGAGISSRNAESPPPPAPRRWESADGGSRSWTDQASAAEYKAALITRSLADLEGGARRPVCAGVNLFARATSASVQVSALYSRTVSIDTAWNNAGHALWHQVRPRDCRIARHRTKGSPGKPFGLQEPDRRGRRTADNAEALSPVHAAPAHKIAASNVKSGTQEHDGLLCQGEVVGVAKHADRLSGLKVDPRVAATEKPFQPKAENSTRTNRKRRKRISGPARERTTRFRERAAAVTNIELAIATGQSFRCSTRGTLLWLAACPIKQNSCDLDAQHQLATLKSIQPQKSCTSRRSSSRQQQQQQQQHACQCTVCGDKALGYNFDAITCESCKAFFRRNAL
uniref:Nuclear receptor domain-containing protein n=1 Tax=Macrostomum lignano TaxID=282301 RepID=A0A1I8FCC7_9PLAT